MELAITFRNLDSTEAIRDFAEKRFKKVEKHLLDPTSAHITLSVDDRHRHRADITVHTKGEPLHASEMTEDMYAAINKAMDKVEAAAQKQKDRVQDHHPKH